MDLTLWCTQRILISTFSSCCLVWIVVVSVYKLSTPSTMLHKYVGSSNLANRNSLQEVREGYRAIHAKNSSVPFSAVLSDFCAHFTGDPHTEFYLNYTSTSANNLRYDAYSKVSRNLTAKYHFAVNSAPGNFERRATIRETWKHLFEPSSTCSEFGTLLFYVGKTSDPEVARKLTAELEEHADDMVLLDFCDAYENLPMKMYSMMAFIGDQFPRVEFMVKIDDDMLPNLSLLYRCFDKVSADGRYGIYGWVTTDDVQTDGKYGIPAERYTGGPKYPYFAHGPAYVVRTTDFPRLMTAAATTPILNLEDVWLTGIVADKAGVQRCNVRKFMDLNRRKGEFTTGQRAMERAIFFHDTSSTEVKVAWVNYPQNCDNMDQVGICGGFSCLS